MTDKPLYRAFISSTFVDLKEHRARVIDTLRKSGISVDPMEDWTADEREPKQFSQQRIDGCNLCILLVAFRRGYVPDGASLSITQMEYQHALAHGITVLPFLLGDDEPWPRRFDDMKEDPGIGAWREELRKKHGVGTFSFRPESLDVGPAVMRWLHEDLVPRRPKRQTNPGVAIALPNQPENKRRGRYRLLRSLGAGGMGEVWLGEDRILNRQVAVKVLPPLFAADPERLRRFELEAQSAARVNHPNTVTIYDFGRAGSQVFLVMEYVDGGSLEGAIEGGRPLPWQEATAVLRDAASGLAAVHALGLTHHDIKPSNLLRTADKKRTKLADFGLVRVRDATRQTVPGAAFGTPLYMAPEQWRGERGDPRTDLYSLVATYFALLTGHPPYDDNVHPGLLKLFHLNEPFRDPASFGVVLPATVLAVLRRGSEKDPEARYQTADELLAAIDELSETRWIYHDDWTPEWRAIAELECPMCNRGFWGDALGDMAYVCHCGSAYHPACLLLLLSEGRTCHARPGTHSATRSEFRLIIRWMAGNKPPIRGSGNPRTLRIRIDSQPELAQITSCATARAEQQRWARYLKLQPEWTNDLGLRFRLIPPGRFNLGANPSDKRAQSNEKPRRPVRIASPFWMAAFPVINGVIRRVLETVALENLPQVRQLLGNPAFAAECRDGATPEDAPVVRVNLIEAEALCAWMGSLDGRAYRLPTEAEWEYAARAGAGGIVWWEDSAAAERHLVLGSHGPFPADAGRGANAWGLIDTLGNVTEWTSSAYVSPLGEAAERPREPLESSGVVRGGSWRDRGEQLRLSRRDSMHVERRADHLGFRVVCELPLEAIPK